MLSERLQDFGRPCGFHIDNDATMDRVVVVAESTIEDAIGSYHVVVATSGSIPELSWLNSLCRTSNIPFIAAQTRGLFSYVFADLGDSFEFQDNHDDSSSLILIANITQDSPATVTVVEEQRHGLEDGDDVVFTGIKGMRELNQDTNSGSNSYRVTVTGSHTFSIPVDTRGFGRYLSGGYFQKLIPTKKFSYIPLELALGNPIFSAMDNLELSPEPHIHVALQAIDEFIRSNKDNNVISNTDIDNIVTRAQEIWEVSSLSTSRYSMTDSKDRIGTSTLALECLEDKEKEDNTMRNENGEDKAQEHHEVKFSVLLGNLDEKLVRTLAHTMNVELCPLVALTGGLAAQEVIKVYIISHFRA